jgi:hypothetical protein
MTVAAGARVLGARVAGPALLVGVALFMALVFSFSPLAALAAACGLCLLACGLRWPAVATPAVLFLLYSNLPAVGVAFHGVPMAVAAAFPLLLLIPLSRDLLVRRQGWCCCRPRSCCCSCSRCSS